MHVPSPGDKKRSKDALKISAHSAITKSVRMIVSDVLMGLGSVISLVVIADWLCAPVRNAGLIYFSWSAYFGGPFTMKPPSGVIT